MKKNHSNVDVYQIVTDRICAMLEKGIIPWQRPWHGAIEGAFNRISRKPYSILNQCLLSETGEYATYKQWTQLGGKLKQDAECEIVVFWKMLKREYIDETEVNEEDKHKVKLIPCLRYYRVYHISQIEGVEPLEFEREIHDPIERAEEVITNYVSKDHLIFQNNQPSNRAYYAPALDMVVVPMLSQFPQVSEYYSTCFHELTHSTMHKRRLDRANTVSHFGSEEYSKEELVAELGAANMLNTLGIETDGSFKNSAAYIQSWLRALQNDKKMIVYAASQAQKATDYILSFSDLDASTDEAEVSES